MRPALITPFPTRTGFCVVLDVGANADTKPEHMQQFGIMGSIYAQQALDVKNPGVYLLSNGEEAGKGNQLVLAAYDLLRQTPGIRFMGNVESKEVMDGKADVVVTDGFTGNIFLKTSEALAGLVQSVMSEELTRGPISTMGAFLAQSGLRRVRARMDDSQYGGAVLLGLLGPVVVAHGRAKANAIRHAVRVAKNAIEHDLTQRLQVGIAAAEASKDTLQAEAASEEG
jgi:glycerol-3-phosphate acyltransferase PlsX